MTNAEMIEKFAQQLIQRVKFRMETFGDSYEKAKGMVSAESCAGIKCWAIVDEFFAK